MLSEEEENIIKEFKENAVASNYTIHPTQLEWVCERLLEINEEAQQLADERDNLQNDLDDANKELTRHAEFD